MASRVTDQGLQDSLDNSFGIAASDPVDAMGISDFGAIAAGTTSIAAAANKDVNLLSSATRTGQTVTVVGVWGTGEGNFTITTITLHNDGGGAFTGVYGGVDNQSLTKTSDFILTITMKITYATT